MAQDWLSTYSEEQQRKLNKIITKIPGLSEYLAQEECVDLVSGAREYKDYLRYNERLSSAVGVNIDYLIGKCEVYNKEQSSDSVRPVFCLSSIKTWLPKPNWTYGMKDFEIDYINTFILQVPNLLIFLKEHITSENLYDLITEFSNEHPEFEYNDQIKFILSVIQDRFYYIMENHSDGIHYVNHKHEIIDTSLFEDFNKDVQKIHFNVGSATKEFRTFLEKYIKKDNPYVNSWLFKFLFRNNDVDLALYSARYTLQHTFSSPNKYWDNKESIYGCADALYTIVDAIGNKGIDKLKVYDEKLQITVIETLFHLFSRIIYWTDKETNKSEHYSSDFMPINVQHKLRAYRLRSSMINKFGNYFSTHLNSEDIEMMCLSDLNQAHKKAEENKIVGNNSLFKQESERIYKRCFAPKQYLFVDCANSGLELNDGLAKQLHEKYRQGKYSLSFSELLKLLRFLREYFKDEEEEAHNMNLPISYLKKDNFSPALKNENNVIKEHLNSHGIQYFYHFTEREKLFSIKQNGGLMSSRRCLDEGIVLPITTDVSTSRDRDAELGLDDYARLSFCEHLPLIDIRKQQGKDLVLLKIDPKVALFEETRFTDIEATYENVKHGDHYEDLQKVDIDVTQKCISEVTEEERPYYQAEVLVKSLVPLKYILNIDDPITL